MSSLRWLRSIRFVFAALLLTVSLAGCGSGGGSSSHDGPQASRPPAEPNPGAPDTGAADSPDNSPPGPPPASRSAGGIPVGGHPNWEERTLLVLTNMVRADPQGYLARYTNFNGILLPENYPPVSPLYWQQALNEAARYHAEDMAENNCFQHNSCEGTLWSHRVRSFYPGATSLWENIAAGTPGPMETLNLLLCEGSPPCVADLSPDDGHRANIMAAAAKELGTGYAWGPPGSYRHYWVQDFGGNSPTVTPPLVAGSHLLVDGVLMFYLNYDTPSGSPPQSVILDLEGTRVPMDLELGAAPAGTFVAAAATPPACSSYHFEAIDANGERWRYPGSGALRTYGVAGCPEDYAP